MKKTLMTLGLMLVFAAVAVLAADPPVTDPAKAQAQVQTQGKAQKGVQFVDANANGLCDNFEQGSPKGKMNRGGKAGSGKGTMARDGSGAGSGNKYGRGGGQGGGRGNGGGQRLRDGSCGKR